jgi:hypothetical protein
MEQQHIVPAALRSTIGLFCGLSSYILALLSKVLSKSGSENPPFFKAAGSELFTTSPLKVSPD